jgi:ADP-ribose pyrophosphatase
VSSVFVYGTLRHPPLMALVAGGAHGRAAEARLRDHVVYREEGGILPVITRAEGHLAHGTLWRGIGEAALARLTDYEVPFGYVPVMVNVETDAGREAAVCFFPPREVRPSSTPWSLDEWINADGSVTLHLARELAAHDPRPDAESLRREWRMMRHRAEAKHRGATEAAPTEIRRAMQPGDAEIVAEAPVAGSFFKYRSVQLRHRQFDGGDSGVLSREGFQGAEAALLLPYDPATDRVLLVEQFRVGPFLRCDAQPWTLEPVAGMVDPGETPEACAIRECHEEAGLEVARTEFIAGFYPSPGASTEFHHAYLGIVSLEGDIATNGGLDEEGEDLRLHVMPFDAAMALVESGEINAGPLITMLFWLARARERLRAGEDA